MKIFYKGDCGYCKKAINGRDYIWIPLEKRLMHKKCYELYKKKLNQSARQEEDFKELRKEKI